MKKLLLLFAACGWLTLPSFAQSHPQKFITAANAHAAGFSADRLKRIDSFLQATISKGLAPNAVTFIARNGQIVHYKAFGYSNLEQRKLLQKDAIFRIASQTKLITTIALMMLYEEGKFFLDDPLSKYIPEFKDAKVLVSYNREKSTYETRPATTPPTIRHLLSHTAGIPYEHPLDSLLFGGKLPGLNSLKNDKLEDVVKKIASRPLLHDPGAAFTYGMSIDVAGRLVEIFSGMSLSDFFQQRIFKPLGMEDSYFYLPPAKANRLVELYSLPSLDSTLKPSDNLSNRTFATSGAQTLYLGGAGSVGTIADYAKVCQLILNGGTFNGVRLLSRKTVDLMTRNQIGNNMVWDRNDKFGLGLQIITADTHYGDQASPGSLTWGGAYCSEYTIDPRENLILLVYTNVLPYANYGEFVRKFRILTYGALD